MLDKFLIVDYPKIQEKSTIKNLINKVLVDWDINSWDSSPFPPKADPPLAEIGEVRWGSSP